MTQTFAKSWVRTSVLVSPEFYELCKLNRIKFSEAFRVGISLMLAEKGLTEYDNNLNLFRKMNLFKIKAEEALSKIYELENKDDNIKSTSETR